MMSITRESQWTSSSPTSSNYLPSLNTHRSQSANFSPYQVSSPLNHDYHMSPTEYEEQYKAPVSMHIRSPMRQISLHDPSTIERSFVKHQDDMYTQQLSFYFPTIPRTMWDLDTGMQLCMKDDRIERLSISMPFDRFVSYWMYYEEFYKRNDDPDNWKYQSDESGEYPFNVLNKKPLPWNEYIPTVLENIVTLIDGPTKKNKKDIAVPISEDGSVVPSTSVEYIPWRCGFPGRCRYPGTYTNFQMNFNLTESRMTMDKFLDMLDKGNGEIVLNLNQRIVSNTFDYTHDTAKTTGCIVPEYIFIDEVHSTLPDDFDIQLFTTPYIKDTEDVPWFSSAGTSNSVIKAANKFQSVFNHVIYPGSNRNRTMVYQADAITKTPLFQRWLFVNPHAMQAELSRWPCSPEGMCQIQCPGSSEIHFRDLMQYVALTEAPRMLLMAYERKDDFPNSKPSQMVAFNKDKSNIYVHKTLLDHVVSEKFTGPMNRNRHVMRVNEKIYLRLRLHDTGSTSRDKKIQLLRELYGTRPVKPELLTDPKYVPERPLIASFGITLSVWHFPWEGK